MIMSRHSFHDSSSCQSLYLYLSKLSASRYICMIQPISVQETQFTVTFLNIENFKFLHLNYGQKYVLHSTDLRPSRNSQNV